MSIVSSTSSASTAGTQTILVVDDDIINRQILAAVLAPLGRVITATDGASAIATARNEQPDLILLDVMMPDMAGWDVCEVLKHDPLTQEIPVIFVTALDERVDEQRGLDAGAVDYVTKPVNTAITRARARTHLELKRIRDQLAELAFVDELTGVANRRRFEEIAALELRRARRHESPLGLALIDVDQFKQFNDHHGHLEGDACLKQVADVLTAKIRRPGDLVARYGGEEFVCLLPETPATATRMLGERLRQAVEDMRIPHKASSVAGHVTVSIGLACETVDGNSTVKGLLAAADRCLYAAKEQGRNRVVGAEIVGPDAAHPETAAAPSGGVKT